ncbi:CCR4-NOT transcription complex subunit 4 [Entamoeba marina]
MNISSSEATINNFLSKTILQKTLVYVTNLPFLQFQNQPVYKIEQELKQYNYFGQYGEIISLIVNAKVLHTLTSPSGPSFSCYITYTTEESALTCIKSIDQCIFHNKVLNASFGTTKYCIYFLKNEPCRCKSKCTYLHSFAKETDYITKYELSKGIHRIHNPFAQRKAIDLKGNDILPPPFQIIPQINFIDGKIHYKYSNGSCISFYGDSTPDNWNIQPVSSCHNTFGQLLLENITNDLFYPTFNDLKEGYCGKSLDDQILVEQNHSFINFQQNDNCFEHIESSKESPTKTTIPNTIANHDEIFSNQSSNDSSFEDSDQIHFVFKPSSPTKTKQDTLLHDNSCIKKSSESIIESKENNTDDNSEEWRTITKGMKWRMKSKDNTKPK